MIPVAYQRRREPSDSDWIAVDEEDVGFYMSVGQEVRELYDHPLFTPTERAYLLKLLGGPLEGVEGFTAQDVLVLRGKVEGI